MKTRDSIFLGISAIIIALALASTEMLILVLAGVSLTFCGMFTIFCAIEDLKAEEVEREQ